MGLILKSIVKRLREDTQTPLPVQPVQQTGDSTVSQKLPNTIDLPDLNMTASFFEFEKRVLLTPQDHISTTYKIKNFLNFIKQHFRIFDIKKLDQGSFEIIFDPREDFQSVIDLLKQSSGE